MNLMEIRNEFAYAMDILIMSRIRDLRFNRTEYGVITVDKGNNLYSVRINQIESDIYSVNNPVLAVGDVVIIIIGNNNFNTDKYILGKRPY